MGGAFCRTENLFARLASVGLTVLAPKPVACEDCGMPGITDNRFTEEGVFVPRPLLLPGDLPANDEDLLCSGVLTAKCVCPCLDGGWRDLVLAALDAVKPRAPSV